jgi:hypothetical protein
MIRSLPISLLVCTLLTATAFAQSDALPTMQELQQLQSEKQWQRHG